MHPNIFRSSLLSLTTVFCTCSFFSSVNASSVKYSHQRVQPELIDRQSSIESQPLPFIQRFKRLSLHDDNQLINELSALEASAVDSDDFGGLFKLSPNTIIKAKDSQAHGAKYLNGTEVYSNHDCMQLCVQQLGCTLAVFERKVSRQ